MELLADGYDAGEVAQRVGVDRRSVRRWKAAHREGGEAALSARPVSGRPAKLTARQRQELETLLLAGPEAAGFATDLWTCPRVRDLIRSRFSVRYHVDHIGRLLRSLGWSPQRPQRRAVERDEDKIQGWIKTTWPRIKKKPHG
jgi:transposase